VLPVSGGPIGGRGGKGGGRPPDSRFVTYGAPVQQVVNIKCLFIIFKIIKPFYIGNSLRVTSNCTATDI